MELHHQCAIRRGVSPKHATDPTNVGNLGPQWRCSGRHVRASWVAEEGATLGAKPVVTSRLEVRPPSEADRDRFVELFCDEDFMVFSGVLTEEAANRRFDHMVEICEVGPFSKQPIVGRGDGNCSTILRNRVLRISSAVSGIPERHSGMLGQRCGQLPEDISDSVDGRTIITEQWACSAQCPLTDPRVIPSNPPRPRLPTTSSSAWRLRSTSTLLACPSTTSTDVATCESAPKTSSTISASPSRATSMAVGGGATSGTQTNSCLAFQTCTTSRRP